MGNTLQQTLSRALLVLLRPLVRILLRNGIAYGSFAELVKKTYVDVAFDSFAPPGKKQTISAVSALTGLTRKEAKRLHELAEPADDSREQRYNRAVRVISGWVNDPEFQDGDGEPAVLPVDGDRASFTALVRKYSGDVTPQSMLRVLADAATVAHEGDRVRLLEHAFVPGSDPVEKLHILGSDVGELIDTIDHNLTAVDHDLRYQRKVFNHRVDPDAVAAFRDLSAHKAQALLEELDAWLARHEAKTDAEGRYVSLGIYFYEDDPDSEKQS